MSTFATIAEGLGWAVIGATARTVAKHVVGASSASADVAGVAVPMIGAVLTGSDLEVAALGSAAGVVAAEIGDQLAPSTARIIAWGDDHGRNESRGTILRHMERESAVDLYVFLGDAEGWDRWERDVAGLKKRSRVLAVPGNHDDGIPASLGEKLPMVLRLASANLVLLGDPPTKRATEKVMRLLDPRAEHTVVFVHRSPMVFSRESEAGVVLVRDALSPLLERGCVVVCGHQHVYGWGTIGPSSVVGAGIAGSKHYTCKCETPCMECDDDVRGYLRLDIGRKVGVSLVSVPEPDDA